MISGLKKRGFLFTLDVVLCIVIVAVGFILSWAALTSEPPKQQPYLLADSVASLMVSTKNYDVLDKLGAGLQVEIQNNYNLEDSMWEQIGYFYLNGSEDSIQYADEYVSWALNMSLPAQYSMQVLFNNLSIYNDTSNILGHSQSNASFIVSAKRLVVLVVNDTELKGPYIAEVRIW